ITHHHHLMDSWAHMTESMKTGRPNRGRASFSDEERESFLMGMFVMGMHTAPTLAKEIDLAGRKSLIDIGGGPGTFAIHFCLENPQLKARVYDLPTTRPFAEKTIENFNLSDRIKFMEGDYVDKTIEGVYDVAWLSHILHGEGPDTCLDILRKAVAVLEPGGLVCIHEFILQNTMDGPLFPTLFSINMLLGTESGQSYSQAQLTDMLKEVGVKNIKRLPYVGPTESGILIGTT
ncbi:MAG: methyltransferase, partial [Deltaproteobacteria bacterium]